MKAYVPGYEKATRSGHKTVELQMLVFCCVATGMVNCQIVEGGKSTGNYLEAFNRFFMEAAVPKVIFPDKDGALLKCLREGQIDLIKPDGTLARERGGIEFETCPSQGHEAHGKIDPKIKSIQECMESLALKISAFTLWVGKQLPKPSSMMSTTCLLDTYYIKVRTLNFYQFLDLIF